jgi:hypothetical protein
MTSKRVGERRLHTDHDGVVWSKEPGQDPVAISQTAVALSDQSWVLNAEKVMLLGTRDNAELICTLQVLLGRMAEARPHRLLIGNPRLQAARYTRLSTIMGHMDGYDFAPSLGGWRELIGLDYVTYALVGVLNKSTVDYEHRDRLLLAHPAWPALSFIDNCCSAAAAKLLCIILDPRWHVDPAKPDACKRLYNLCGLGRDAEQNIQHLLFGDEYQPGHSVEAARAVLDTWFSLEKTVRASVKPSPKQDCEVPPSGQFLRKLAAADGSQKRVAGIVKACRVFLTFLQSVWLDNLTPSQKYIQVTRRLGRKKASNVTYGKLQPESHYNPTLFVPEYFFADSSEVQAWYRHKAVVSNHA